jgi:hypothetical protein
VTPREQARKIFARWMNVQNMKLCAGEMSAQEVRTAYAIVDSIRKEIDQILCIADVPEKAGAHRTAPRAAPQRIKEAVLALHRKHPDWQPAQIAAVLNCRRQSVSVVLQRARTGRVSFGK